MRAIAPRLPVPSREVTLAEEQQDGSPAHPRAGGCMKRFLDVVAQIIVAVTAVCMLLMLGFSCWKVVTLSTPAAWGEMRAIERVRGR